MPFIAGILFSVYVAVPPVLMYVLLFASLAWLFIDTKRNRSQYLDFFGLSFFVFLFAVAMILSVERAENHTDSRLSQYKGQLIGQLASEPVVAGKNMKIRLDCEAIKLVDNWYETKGNILVYLKADENSQSLKAGDKIVMSPDLKQFENKGNPGEFDYKKYMWYQYVQYSDFLDVGEWQKIDSYSNNTLIMKAAAMRNYIIAQYEKYGLSGDELGVATALTLGNKSYLSDEVRQSYSSSGGMHVLAVSGLHVGVFYIVISQIFGFLKSKKYLWLKTMLIVGSIWFYAFLTGLSPSVTRAATMFSLFSLAAVTQRSRNSYNVLAASAFIALLFNPFALFQIGFQLSYAAVFSILFFFDKIHNLISPRNWILQKLWSLVAVSLSAQIGTIPFTLFYFQQFPTYFLLTNIVLIPLVSVAIYLAIALAVFSWLPTVASLLGWLFKKCIGFMNASVAGIESLPGSVISNLHITTFEFVVLLMMLAVVVLIFSERRAGVVIAGLGLSVVFATSLLYRNVAALSRQHIVVYNLKNTTALNLIDGRDNLLFVNTSEIDAKARNYSLNGYWRSLGLHQEKTISLSVADSKQLLKNIVNINNPRVFMKNGFIGFYDIRIFIPDDRHNTSIAMQQKLRVDYVLFTDECSLSLQQLNEMVQYRLLLIDGSVNRHRAEQILSQALGLGIDVHSVAHSGAFLL